MASRARSAAASKVMHARAVETTTLHPLIRRQLGQVDLRCTEVLRVEDNVALDVIVRNGPISR